MKKFLNTKLVILVASLICCAAVLFLILQADKADSKSERPNPPVITGTKLLGGVD